MKNIQVSALLDWCKRHGAHFTISRFGVMAVALGASIGASAMTPVPSVATLAEIMEDEDKSESHGFRLEPRENAIYLQADGYDSLALVLQRAFIQAAHGKGAERHAQGEPFDAQVMQDGARRFGVGGLLFQAFKKSEESQRLPRDAAVKELLGAINYLAGAVIALERLPVAANDNAPKEPAQNNHG